MPPFVSFVVYLNFSGEKSSWSFSDESDNWPNCSCVGVVTAIHEGKRGTVQKHYLCILQCDLVTPKGSMLKCIQKSTINIWVQILPMHYTYMYTYVILKAFVIALHIHFFIHRMSAVLSVSVMWRGQWLCLNTSLTKEMCLGQQLTRKLKGLKLMMSRYMYIQTNRKSSSMTVILISRPITPPILVGA